VSFLGSFTTGLHTATTGNGVLTPGSPVAGVPAATWLVRSPDGRFLYATNELDEGRVSALDLADPERPALLGAQPTRGAQPTHLALHPGGRWLLTANYGSGTVVTHPVGADGALGEPADAVTHAGPEPHAHQVLTDPSGTWVLAVDLGADSVYVYAFDPGTGQLTEHDRVRLADGTGPRHLAFHPGGGFGYLLAEFRSEVTPFAWDPAAGRLALSGPVDTLTRFTGAPNHPAEVLVSADGRFVYTSNRGDNSIATFVVEQDGAALRLLATTPTGGDWPRHCALDDAGNWLYVANQNSGTVTWLPRDPASGLLAPAAGSARTDGVAVVLL
jgi:6-phosphogluconolactonase